MPRTHGPRQYVGRLTPRQAAEGIQAALANARALLSEAELLLGHGRWPRAVALSILAIEEAGKPALIRALLLARNDGELSDEWRAYRSHVQKNINWILPELAAKGAAVLEDLRLIVDPTSDHPHILEALKQVAFYSDVYGECRWSIPAQAIDEDAARRFVALARLLASGPEAMTTEAELELWVKHMAPVWKGDMSDMKQALVACYAEAEAHGVLWAKATASEMVRFLF